MDVRMESLGNCPPLWDHPDESVRSLQGGAACRCLMSVSNIEV